MSLFSEYIDQSFHDESILISIDWMFDQDSIFLVNILISFIMPGIILQDRLLAFNRFSCVN